MSSGCKIGDQTGLYFMTFTVVGWVDLFSRKTYKDIVIESFKYCQAHKGLNLFAYVIMTNHIHLLASSEVGDISGFIRDFKNFTTKRFLEVIETTEESRRDWLKIVFDYHAKLKPKQSHQIWIHESHPEHIYSQKFIEQKIDYIHNNPVRAGIVEYADDYLYSSARNYANRESPIEVIKVDFLWKTVS